MSDSMSLCPNFHKCNNFVYNHPYPKYPYYLEAKEKWGVRWKMDCTPLFIYRMGLHDYISFLEE